VHLSKALKFLVMKDRDGLLAIGGSYDPERDGPDPTQPQALINTAKRHVYEMTKIDLSPVTGWVRFIEMWYQRDDHQEITVVFLPDLSEIAPTLEQVLAQWEHRQAEEAAKEQPSGTELTEAEKEEKARKEEEEKAMLRAQAESPLEPKDLEMEDEDDEAKKKKEEEKKEKKKEEPPKEPSFTAVVHKTPESKRKLMVISLDGLLDYDETDKLEATFELSLFAESLHLMLQVRTCFFIIFNFPLLLLLPSSPHLFLPLFTFSYRSSSHSQTINSVILDVKSTMES
jgi:DBC1/LAIKA domain